MLVSYCANKGHAEDKSEWQVAWELLEAARSSTPSILGWVWPDMVRWLKDGAGIGVVNLHRTQEDPDMVPVYLSNVSATALPAADPEHEARNKATPPSSTPATTEKGIIK